jgi:hypothetical protein
VLFGQRERENEAKFDDSAMRPASGTAAVHGAAASGGQPDAAAAEAPAGDDEAAHALATGAKGEKIRCAECVRLRGGVSWLGSLRLLSEGAHTPTAHLRCAAATGSSPP